MKKTGLLVISTFFIHCLLAQTWQQQLKPNATFSEIQTAFNDYWKYKDAPKNETDAEEDGDYMHYKRWEHFMQSRLDENGYFPAYKLYDEYSKQKKLKKTASSTSANWTYIGPQTMPNDGGAAGRINTMEFNPTNSNTIWIGAANGGLWKSTNGGTSWTTNTDNLTNISIADIEIDPTNTNIMYLATGDNSGYEAYGAFSGFWGGTYSAGLLKSIDGGNSWSSTGLTFSQTNFNIIQKIILFPSNTQIILAATRNSIQRSADGGATWTTVSSSHMYDFEIEPTNSNIIYAVGDGKFLKSTNQGLTWTSTTMLSTGSNRMSISISQTPSQKMYILHESGDLYYSTNSGVSFSLACNVPSIANMSLYGYYDCVLEASPTNSDEVYVAGLQIVKSTDGGFTWQEMGDWTGFPNPNYVHADNHYIKFLPGSSSTIFSCNDGGIFKSTNNGNTWIDLSANLNIAQYYRIGSALSMPTEYYLGQQDIGTVLKDASVSTMLNFGDGMESVVDNTNPNNAIISTQNGSLYNTNDHWITANDISVLGGMGEWVTPFELDPQNQNIIYAAYEDLYKSYDFGFSWTPISNFNLASTGLEALAVAPSNSNYIYTSSLKTIYKTTNGGTNWTNISAGLPTANNRITSIAVSNLDPNKVWVTYGGYTSGSKVYMTINGGTSWTNFSGTLPNVPCNTIVHQTNSNYEMYVGTDFGVYYRDQSMSDWAPFQNGLPNVIVNELEIIPSLNAIRAATYGRGAWQSNLNNNISVGLGNQTTSSLEMSLSPNPSSGIFYVNTFDKETLYTISINDMLGKQVFNTSQILLNNFKLDLSNLSSGCYFAVINSKTSSTTKKIVINK